MKKIHRLTAVVVPLAVVAFALAFQPVGQSGIHHQQDPETNSATNRNDSRRGVIGNTNNMNANKSGEPTWNLPADAAEKKNPVEATAESVEKGKEIYLNRSGNCVFCHGTTGAGNEENLPRLRRKPADLSNKERMMMMTDGEVFWKITLGIPGIMPAREKQLTEEQRWHVVNYVRTLGVEKPKGDAAP